MKASTVLSLAALALLVIAAKGQDSCVHVVQPGEYLNSIGEMYGLSADDLLALNPQYAANPDLIQPGGDEVLLCEGQGAYGTAPQDASEPESAPQGIDGTSSGCPDAQAALEAHNAARARYGAAPLTWSEELVDFAQSYSETCARGHSNNGRYGENLGWGHSGCAAAVEQFIAEEADWQPGMGFSRATGHFTQVVWKSTTAVGCGWNPSCRMTTCSYYPPGNVQGQFDENV